jgi:hypothetical protein
LKEENSIRTHQLDQIAPSHIQHPNLLPHPRYHQRPPRREVGSIALIHQIPQVVLVHPSPRILPPLLPSRPRHHPLSRHWCLPYPTSSSSACGGSHILRLLRSPPLQQRKQRRDLVRRSQEPRIQQAFDDLLTRRLHFG